MQGLQPALTLAGATHDLSIVETRLPQLTRTMKWLRAKHEEIAISIALSNGADPDTGVTANFRALFTSCCDGIQEAISEAEKHSTIVRQYVDAHPEARNEVAPSEIYASWHRFMSACRYAEDELGQLRQLLAI
jgi:hypothetical protein